MRMSLASKPSNTSAPKSTSNNTKEADRTEFSHQNQETQSQRQPETASQPHFDLQPPPLYPPHFHLNQHQFHDHLQQNHNQNYNPNSSSSMIANSINDFNPFHFSQEDHSESKNQLDSPHPHPHSHSHSHSHSHPLLTRSPHSADSDQDSNSTYNQSPFSNLDPQLQGSNLPNHQSIFNQSHLNPVDPSGLASSQNLFGNHFDFSNHHDFSIDTSPNSLGHSDLHSDITDLNEWSAKHLIQFSSNGPHGPHSDSNGDGDPSATFMAMQNSQNQNRFGQNSSLGLGQLEPHPSPISPMELHHLNQLDPSSLLSNPNLFTSPTSIGNGFLPSPSLGNQYLGHLRSGSYFSQKSEEGDSDASEMGQDQKDSSTSNKRIKVQEESGSRSNAQQTLSMNCEACREKHLKCDLKSGGEPNCSRCVSQKIECVKTYSPPRRPPRSSRSGKRIEQARLIHGSVSGPSGSSVSPPISALQLTRADNRISSQIMGGSLSLKLLACFFATAHQQMPCVDFTLFATRYNAARGDPRVMSIMANGGDESLGIQSLTSSTPGVNTSPSPLKDIQNSTISTPGSSEALIAAMQAWAAHYTDAPIAFGNKAKELGLGGKRLLEVIENNQDDDDREEKEKKTRSNVKKTSIFSSVKPDDPSIAETLKNGKGVKRRPKRKQGVACDSCKIRRIRCSLFDPGRPEGAGCSQCESKGIVCTDVYIQSKKKEKEEKIQSGKFKPSTLDSTSTSPSTMDEVISSNLSLSTNLTRDSQASSSTSSNPPGVGPNSWKGQALEMKDWADAGPQEPFKNNGGNGKDMIKWGKAREPFCRELLNRAKNLVEKHDLLRKPSVEAIQTLLILISIADFSDKEYGRKLSLAAARHQITLQLRARFEVDERDQKAVEKFLSEMQHTRVYLSMWTRDAIASGMYRVRPTLIDDRAVEVNGGKTEHAEEGQPSTSSSSDSLTRTSRDGNSGVHLSGEMGLTFSIMALIQVGALSRFIAKHIDVVYDAEAGSADMEPSQRFPSILTSNQLRKINKACNAVWQSIDALMLFFDRCTAKAKEDLDRLGRLAPFQPLNWIAGIKICGSMLHLAMYRVIGERMRVNAAYLNQLSQAYAKGEIQQGPSREQLDQAKALRELFETSRSRALTSCRRAARLIAFLLPRRIFHTSGILLRQLFPVAQFLARSPVVESPGRFQSSIPDLQTSTDPTSTCGIDPRRLSTSPTLSKNTNLPESDLHHSSEGAGQTHVPLNAAMAELGPFDQEAKELEVGWVIQGLEQIGYAWSDMEQQIESVQTILEMSRRGS